MLAREHMLKDNFIFLFIALIVFLAVLPIGNSLHIVPDGVTWLIAITSLLLVGVMSLRDAGWRFHAGIALVVAGIAASAYDTLTGSTTADLLSRLALFAFLLLGINNALRQVVYGVEMNANRLYGAVCVYLMIGLLWSMMFMILQDIDPNSFGGNLASNPEEAQVDWLYYSFVTLTTLGYGDILPLSAPARALAYVEAIVGVFYMAMLVAALVSGYITQVQSDRQ